MSNAIEALTPPRILLIDDQAIERSKIIECFRAANFPAVFVEAANGIEAVKMLLTTPVDLIISDLLMPTMDGFRFLEVHGSRPNLKDVPVIMLTTVADQKHKVDGLENGANDYLVKPYDGLELVARAKVQLRIKKRREELQKTHRDLSSQNITDPLTQIMNRRGMMETLEREYNRSRRKKYPLSLALFDIDHFKQVNDTFGHPVGDMVLKLLAETAQLDLRGYDSVARYGGEEFVLILPDTEAESAFMVCDRLRARIENLTFNETPAPLRVTVSMGISTCPANGTASIEQLLNSADANLYKAKNSGRNQVIAESSA